MSVSGLKTAFAIVPGTDMRSRFEQSKRGMVDSVNILGLAGMAAAYGECTAWRAAAVARIAANRDHLAARLAALLPEVRMLVP